ncbi:addiction module protein [Corallococcus sp. CA049B]|uniref:addiction module protein n=1 Tax=Corallococcus sp. CA049B TaxID=2316730 RepID=UPI0013155A8D|nr:addiction module protein [Corallococcus sp. CA049B]
MMVMATLDEVFTLAQLLSPEDQRQLAHRLMGSAEDAEKAWGEEISRRAQEVLDGTVKLVSLEEVERKMEERARRRR